MNYFRSQVPGS